MDEKQDATRCKQCDHLTSFHGEDGCGTWLLGVRAVPLYRCACVVSPMKSGTKFPIISTSKFQVPPVIKTSPSLPQVNEPTIANLPPSIHSAASAQANLRNRLNDVAEGLRRTAAELKNLEDTLDNTLRRMAPGKAAQPPATPVTNASLNMSSIHAQNPSHPTATHITSDSNNRRASNDRRRRHYAMIAERRVSERRTVAA